MSFLLRSTACCQALLDYLSPACAVLCAVFLVAVFSVVVLSATQLLQTNCFFGTWLQTHAKGRTGPWVAGAVLERPRMKAPRLSKEYCCFAKLLHEMFVDSSIPRRLCLCHAHCLDSQRVQILRQCGSRLRHFRLFHLNVIRKVRVDRCLRVLLSFQKENLILSLSLILYPRLFL